MVEFAAFLVIAYAIYKVSGLFVLAIAFIVTALASVVYITYKTLKTSVTVLIAIVSHIWQTILTELYIAKREALKVIGKTH